MKILQTLLLTLLIVTANLLAETEYFFPHYGDGDGLSMVFTFENPTDMEARVDVDIFDSNGNLQKLDFVGYGLKDSFYADLEPQGSLTMKTRGNSNPLKVGFVRVQSENDNVTGVAIFQYAWGGETSILPVKAKRRFVLPFEKNSSLDIGLAICRKAKNPIDIELYDTSGNLVDYVYYDPSSFHSAAFSAELFGPVSTSNGTILLKSDSPFAPMGLRFGNGVLASLPSDEAKETSQYWAEKMLETSSFWYFYYTISSTSSNTYTMWQVGEEIGSTPEYSAYGNDEWGDPAIARWVSDIGELFMLDPSIVFDYAYTYTFTSDHEIEGCMYMRDKDTGDLGTCWPLTGNKFVYSSISTEQETAPRSKSENRIEEESEMYKKFVPVISSGPVKEAFDRLADQISPGS